MASSVPGQSLRHCAYCLISISGSEVKLCGKCGRRAYCSRNCQTLDWSEKKTSQGAVNLREQRGQGHKHWCGLTCGEEDLDWAVTPVEGKGLGLVALKPIPARSRIIVDPAQFSPHAHPGTGDLSSGPLPEVPVVDKKRGRKGQGQSDPVALDLDLRRKWDINKLGCGEGDKEESVLCLRIARANHSCDNNAMHIYCSTFKVKILFAERDIAPGEEICISYQSFKSPSSLLSRCSDHKILCDLALKSKWGIICPQNCPCNDPQLLKDVERAVNLDDSILQLAQRMNPDRAMRGVKQLMTLHEGRLKSSFLDKRRTLHDGFQVGIMTKKTLRQGMDYANQMVEIMGDILHPKSEMLLEYEGFQSRPETHRNYSIL